MNKKNSAIRYLILKYLKSSYGMKDFKNYRQTSVQASVVS